MTFYPTHYFRFYNDPFQRLFGDQLDIFDPWRDFNATRTAVPNRFRWINEPLCLARRRLNPILKNKFRVQLNVNGFNPEKIQTHIEGNKLIVEAKYEDRQPNGDFRCQEMRQSYELPENADVDNIASFVTPNQMLVIDVPIRNPDIERRLAEAQAEAGKQVAKFGEYRDPIFDQLGFLDDFGFHRRIVDTGKDGQKQLQMTLSMKAFKPELIKISVKDNELIIQGEHSKNGQNNCERSFFRKSITLPPGTQVDQLQSQLTDDGELKIEAPYIETTEQTQAIEQQPQQ